MIIKMDKLKYCVEETKIKVVKDLSPPLLESRVWRHVILYVKTDVYR